MVVVATTSAGRRALFGDGRHLDVRDVERDLNVDAADLQFSAFLRLQGDKFAVFTERRGVADHLPAVAAADVSPFLRQEVAEGGGRTISHVVFDGTEAAATLIRSLLLVIVAAPLA